MGNAVNPPWFQLVTANEPLLVMALAPALLFPTPSRMLVLVAVPLLWSCGRRSSGHYIPLTPMNGALAVLALMVGVSMFVTFDIVFSLGKIAGVILGLLLYWSIARWLTTAKRLKIAVALFVLAGAGLAIIGFFGMPMPTSNVYKYPALGNIARQFPNVLGGLPGAEDGFNPNPVSGSLVLFVPLQVALLATGASRWLLPTPKRRWPAVLLTMLQLCLLALTSGTVILMQSRGAWTAVVVAAGAFLLWYRWWSRAAVAVATIGLLAFAISRGPTDWRQLAAQVGGTELAGSATARAGLWARAISVIGESPVTGIGMHTFRRTLPIPPGRSDPNAVHAHNHLLQAALDVGVPGLVAYLATWLLAFALLAIVYRRSHHSVERGVAGGLGAGLIAYFTFGIADAIPLGAKVGALYWLTLALCVGLHRIAISPPSTNA